MKLAVMPGNVVPLSELRPLGFEAMQMFFGMPKEVEAGDPAPDKIDATLKEGGLALAAMTLHIDLVGPDGDREADVERAVRCVEKTAALQGRFGDNPRPIMIWHPSSYPGDSKLDDAAFFARLATALATVCSAAEKSGVDLAVEITRAGSVGSAETFLRLKDRVASPALRVCMDAANFAPDRTPLERAVRMLGPDVVIAHAKDVRFADTGLVAAYGPAGSGKIDYPLYVRCLREHTPAAYLAFEYYRSREDLLRARDLVRSCL